MDADAAPHDVRLLREPSEPSEPSEQRWRTICAAFDEAVLLDDAARERYLTALAAHDADVYRSVCTLVAYDRNADLLIGRLDDLPTRPTAVDVLSLAGKMVAHFRVMAPIASGGMGVVYRAEHTRLHRTVALKMPLPTLVNDPAIRARFLREARAAGRLAHPNVCEVHEVGESDDGYLYIAMPLYEGETLRQRLDRSTPLEVSEAVAFARQICCGLRAAHDAGVLHRDLKPANIMLETNGGVRILDFGLARTVDATNTERAGVMGTVSYMAPERISGCEADERADLWSLGVVLYEMLAGARPFERDHPVATAQAILHSDAARFTPVVPHVPRRLTSLVEQLLSKSPADRPATAAVVEEELAAIARGESAPWRHLVRAARTRVRRVMSAHPVRLVLAMMLVAVGVLWARRGTGTREGDLSAKAVAPGGSRDPDASLFFQRAQVYVARGQDPNALPSAIALYERAIARDPQFASARARLAIALVQWRGPRGVPDAARQARARAEIDSALRLVPNLPVAQLARGYWFDAERQVDSAIAAYAVAADGMTSVEPVFRLAQALRNRGDWPQAKQQFIRAVARDSSDMTILLEVALMLQRNREYADAVRVYDRLSILEPDNHAHRLIRGYLFTRWVGNTDTLENTVSQFPPGWNPQAITTARVLAARYRRRPAEALAVLAQSRDSVLQDGYIYWPADLVRGRLYTDLGDEGRAARSFAAAARVLEPVHRERSADYRVTASLGEALAGSGQRARALQIVRTLLDDVRGRGDYVGLSVAMLGAAEIHTRAGNVPEAVALLDSLLDRAAGREASVPILRMDPTWDPLRADPRFERILTRARGGSR